MILKKTAIFFFVLLFLSLPVCAYAKLGIGVEGFNLYNVSGYSPYISFDLTPMLQLRAGGYYSSDPKTEENDEPDTSTDIFVSGIYKLWKGDFSPYVGARIGIYNYHSVYSGTIYRYVTTSGSLLLGVEWSVLNNISLFFNTDLLDIYTVIDKEGTIIDAETTGIGNEFYLGAVLYL